MGGLANGLTAAGATLTATGKNLTSFGTKAMQVGRSMSFLGAGIAYVGYSAVKSFSTYQQEMRLLEAQAGANGRQLIELEHGISGWGKRFGFKPSELAQGLYPIQTVIKNVSGDLTALEAAAMGARVGLDSLPATSNAVAGMMRIHARDIHSAAEAMAVLDVTVGEGKMYLPELTQAVSSGVLTQANQMKLGSREVLALLAAQSAEHIAVGTAATRMRYTLTKLAAENSPKALEAMRRIGLEQFSLAEDFGKPGGLLKALRTLDEHLKRVSKNEQTVILADMFGQSRGLTNAMSVLHALSQGEKNLTRLDHAGPNTLGKHWLQVENTMAVRQARLSAMLDETWLKMGEQIGPYLIPMLTQLVEVIGSVGGTIAHLPGPARDAAMVLGMIGIVSGPLVYILGSVSTVIGGAYKALGWLLGGLALTVDGEAAVAAETLGLDPVLAALTTGFLALDVAIPLAGLATLTALLLTNKHAAEGLVSTLEDAVKPIRAVENFFHPGLGSTKTPTVHHVTEWANSAMAAAQGVHYQVHPHWGKGTVGWGHTELEARGGHLKLTAMPGKTALLEEYVRTAKYESALLNLIHKHAYSRGEVEGMVRKLHRHFPRLDSERPLAKTPSVQGSLWGSVGQDIHIPVNIDGKKVAEAIARIEREARARR